MQHVHGCAGRCQAWGGNGDSEGWAADQEGAEVVKNECVWLPRGQATSYVVVTGFSAILLDSKLCWRFIERVDIHMRLETMPTLKYYENTIERAGKMLS
jgi:hypothetical protein